MAEKILPHERPNRSRLERWLGEITRMRELNWPYARIAQWLGDEHQFSITREAVRQFCVRREIPKGASPSGATQPRNRNRGSQPERDVAQASKAPAVFQYDDSKPIDRWSEKGCVEGAES
jgi:hypothetical protein